MDNANEQSFKYADSLAAQIANDNGWTLIGGSTSPIWIWNENTDKIVAFQHFPGDTSPSWVGWRRAGVVLRIDGEQNIEIFLKSPFRSSVGTK